MLTTNLLLTSLVVYILLRNHFKKNKGVIFGIIALLSANLKLIAETFPPSYLENNYFILWFVMIHPIIGFLIPPLELLFINSFLIKKPERNRYIFLLFFPILFVLINFIPYFFLTMEEKIQIFLQSKNALTQGYFIWFSMPTANIISNLYNPILGMITVIYVIKILIKDRLKLSKKSYSNLLQLGTIVFVNFLLLFITDLYSFTLLDKNENFDLFGISTIIPSLSLLLFPNFIYDNANHSDLNLYFRMMNRFSGSRSNEDPVKSELLADSGRIMKYLNEEKPYLSPGFSIHDIAIELDIPQKNVTECFNKVIKISFPKMRNQLRVDYAIEMFRNNSQLKISIEGISGESGFNNRATFYKAFREVTNTTPIEWIRQNCNYTVEEELE